MNRRKVLFGAAAGLVGCATRPGAAVTLTRGLWRDAQGPFAIGRFHEYGEGDFAFDYAKLRVGALVDRKKTRRKLPGP